MPQPHKIVTFLNTEPTLCENVLAPCMCVDIHFWSPASLFCNPADFCFAHQTADPITSVFFLDDDVTQWAFHGLPILKQVLL